ncbi:MAG TPA: sugar phosphate nucleotidyltransferase [Phycisphaerae bacterium]|nr:sugar phosphate nucleotidyltransferase [Phycisphaerae bacterium]
MRYAVIMAGGAGKRLWPLSRTDRPKQLLPLIGGRSLLELAVERLAGLFENENLWVITNAQYAPQVRRALPDIPGANVIGEPQGKDTANAIALAAELIAARDESATMAVFTADHVIRPQERFAEAVETACAAAEAEPDALLTFGIRPTWPHTGLGYIHCGQEREGGVREVRAFKEKPEHPLARQYVESGEHFWNSGMFVWTLGAIRSALNEFLPDSMRRLAPVGRAAREGHDLAACLAEAYPNLQKISIDYAVMEKAPKVLMVELRCDWLDVGSWPALENVLELDEGRNAVVARNTVLMDSSRNVIISEGDHLLAVLGMDDCIVVHSPDATLVCNRSDSQRLKDLVDAVEAAYGKKLV